MKKAITLLLIGIFTLNAIPNNIYNVYGATTLTQEEQTTESNAGEEKGLYFGVIDGYNSGLKNYNENHTDYLYTSTYKTDLSVHTASNDYKEQTTYYKKGFEKGYLEGYQSSYLIGISGDILTISDLISLASSTSGLDVTDGATNGDSQGATAGAIQGQIDYTEGRFKDAQSSLARFELQKSLYNRFYLKYNDSAYEIDFSKAFRESYIDAYESTYQGLVESLTEQNLQFTQINNSQGDFAFVLDLDSSGSSVSFNFPVGSIYGIGYIGAVRERNPVAYNKEKLNFVNIDFVVDTFDVSNFSRSEYISPTKEFTMSIDHNIVSDNIGIYEYKNGGWQYILTDISETSLSHTFPAGKYEGGRYCLFVEPNYVRFDDISFSPFSDEIYTYARRGAIYSSSSNLRPTGNISRGELAYIINGVLNPNNLEVASTNTYYDVAKTSPYYNAINYVSSKGYINGISSSQFGANSAITYNQMKIIIERITGTSFDINSCFNQMMSEKFHKSKGISNLNNYVTKEEAIYMLYYVLN